jgi:hypothetical protein
LCSWYFTESYSRLTSLLDLSTSYFGGSKEKERRTPSVTNWRRRWC